MLPGRFSSKVLYFWGGEKKATSGFVLQVMLRGSLCVSGPCTLQLSHGDTSKLA